MSESRFAEANHFGTLTPDPSRMLAVELYCCYHVLCERYDRRVCSGPIVRDQIVPATTDQRRAINLHASRMFRVVSEMAYACEAMALHRVRKEVDALSYEEMGRIADASGLIREIYEAFLALYPPRNVREEQRLHF